MDAWTAHGIMMARVMCYTLQMRVQHWHTLALEGLATGTGTATGSGIVPLAVHF